MGTALARLSLFIIGALFAMSAAAQTLPAEVTRLRTAVEAVPGASEVSVGRVHPADIALEDLSLPGAFADLPAAALRRSGGARPGEVLISINFDITRGERGLKALEFLAWWVRDRARAGHDMQLRALARPPMAGGEVQLGQTLRFTIDWFLVPPSDDMADLLAALDEAANALEQMTRLYAGAFD